MLLRFWSLVRSLQFWRRTISSTIRRTVKRFAIILFGLTLAVIYLVNLMYFPCPAEMQDARATLIAFSQMLTTTFAISVSLILVGMQFISQTYTPRVLKVLFKDRIFLGYLGACTVSILLILGIVALGFVLEPFVVGSYFLLVFCITYLLLLLFHIPSIIDPSNAMHLLTKMVKEDFCERLVDRAKTRSFILGSDDEPFIGLEQILIRTVVQNDFRTFVDGIKYLESLLSGFLRKTEKELKDETDKESIREKPSDVFSYFLRVYRQVLSESLAHGREEHLMYLCMSLSRLLVQLHRIKAFRAANWTIELFDRAGLCGVDKRLLTFLESYVRDLRDLVKVQMSILDEPIFPFDDLDLHEKWQDLSKEEQEIRTVRSIMFDSFRGSRMEFLSNLTEESAKKGLESTVSFCMHIFSELLDKALTLQPMGKKRVVTQTIMERMVETHKKCVDNGISSTTFTTGMLAFKIDAMKDRAEVEEFGYYMAIRHAKMEEYSIEKGICGGIWNWGVNARHFVKPYPKLAMIAIDVLEAGLRKLRPEKSEEALFYYEQTRRDLESLKDWKSHQHKGIAKHVARILEEYPSSLQKK